MKYKVLEKQDIQLMKYFIDEHLEVYIRNIQDVKSEEKWRMKIVKSAIEYYFKKCKTQDKNNK